MAEIAASDARPDRPELRGLRPHTHEDRAALAELLVGRWCDHFGARLLAVAATGSFARGDDRAYSDLEFLVFLDRVPASGEEPYLQRIYDGMLVEAIYTSEEAFLAQERRIDAHWHYRASAPLRPLYGEQWVARLEELRRRNSPDPADLRHHAAHRFLEVQESFGKVLSAAAARDTRAMPVLLADACGHVAAVLAFINAAPITTLARMTRDVRAMPRLPVGTREWFDLLESGGCADLDEIDRKTRTLFAGFERLFAELNMPLYDDNVDPAVSNRDYGSAGGAS